MTTRELVQLRAKDFHTAVYVGVDDGTRYLVGTDNLCPDCTSPVIVLENLDTERNTGSLRTHHDDNCPIARFNGAPVVSNADRRLVTETRRRYLGEMLEIWPELG